MGDVVNEDIKYCLGCLSRSSQMILYCYKIQIENLKTLLQDECIYLCYICKRLMQKAEEFIEYVNYNQVIMQNLENIENITSKAPKSHYQLSEIEKVILDKTEPKDENDFESPICKIYNRNAFCKVKIEFKQESIEDAKEELNDKCDVPDSSIKEESDFFDPSVKEEESTDIDDNICLYELRETVVKNRIKKKTSKIKKQKNCKNNTTRKENELPLQSIEDDGNKEVSKKKIRKCDKISENDDLGDDLNMVVCVFNITREQCMQERSKMLEDPKFVNMAYKCVNCIKAFRLKESYDTHMLRHNEENGDYECDICKKTMATLEKLLSHQKYHTVRYKCIECDLVRNNRQTIKDHYTAHHLQDSFQYKCSYCIKTFKRRISLKKHITNLHKNKKRQECKLCQKSYASKDTLKAHIIEKHTNKLVLKNDICKECGAAFKSRSHLKAHMMKHVLNKNYYCVECNRSFKTHNSLKQHIKKALPHINYKDLPFKCDHCEKRFGIKRDVERHTNRVHLNIKPYQCDKCDKAYICSWSLAEHSRFAHEGYKRPLKYPCPMCDKVFDRNATRKAHIRTHTGERPYQCEWCAAAFAQGSVRATHVRLVHLRQTRDGRPKRA